MKLVLLGAPGSGKGTVATRLAKELDVEHLSAGEILREEIKKDTSIGQEIKKIVESGKLVPDQFVVEVMKLETQGRNSYILDGYPRTVFQAKQAEADLVIYLEISEEVVIERLSGRRICETGEHTYHIKYIPPKNEGICDIDKTKLIQRKDDNQRVVKKRFQVYNKETAPVIDYYKNKDVLKLVNAAPLPEEVYSEVKKVLKMKK
jgi:adenylate kinase